MNTLLSFGKFAQQESSRSNRIQAPSGEYPRGVSAIYEGGAVTRSKPPPSDDRIVNRNPPLPASAHASRDPAGDQAVQRPPEPPSADGRDKTRSPDPSAVTRCALQFAR